MGLWEFTTRDTQRQTMTYTVEADNKEEAKQKLSDGDTVDEVGGKVHILEQEVLVGPIKIDEPGTDNKGT